MIPAISNADSRGVAPRRRALVLIPGYCWVIVALWFLLRMGNSVSLTDYSLALPFITKEYGVAPKTLFADAGLLTYSFGLFIVYFANVRGWMNTRVRLAVFVAQFFIAVPSILIPLVHSYEAILALRFMQGLWFMELGLCAISFAGWFGRTSLAISVGVPLAALQFGSAVGGTITRYITLATSWQDGFYVAAGIDVAATLLFFALYRDAAGYCANLQSAREKHTEAARSGRAHLPSVWRWPATYSIGLAQNATTMLFASIPFLVPLFGYSLHIPKKTVADTVQLYGYISGGVIILGALVGSALVANAPSLRAVFRRRNHTRYVSYALATAGLILLLTDHTVTGYMTGSVLISCVLFNIGNYWAEMAEVAPDGFQGDFIFAAGTVASFGFIGGPLLTILLHRYFNSYSVVFWVFLAVIAISVIANIWQQDHVPLPRERLTIADETHPEHPVFTTGMRPSPQEG
jgi:MFS family permease